MRQDVNIQRKIAVPVLVAMALLFCLFAAAAVHTLRNQARKNVESEALGIIRVNAEEIRRFLAERARITTTLFKNPHLLEWFADYRVFRRPLEGDVDYRKITRYFSDLIRSDSTIKSVYFATENTQEYFDEEGRFEEEGYFVKDRPWWQKAEKTGRLHCDLSDFDYRDGTISASLQMPVYLKTGRFLGVGGVDILITTVGEIVRKIDYKGQGEAFLIDEQGHIIYLPHSGESLPWLTRIEQLDGIFSDASGMKALGAAMTGGAEGLYDVNWKGKPAIALFTQVDSPEIMLRWSLGLFVPRDAIESPVRNVTRLSILAVIAAVACMFVVTFWITSRTVSPLNALAFRLDEIANRKSDLTVELPVDTQDAIGRTAMNFNAFLSQIRGMVRKVVANTSKVALSVDGMMQKAGFISKDAESMSNQSGRMLHASQEMIRMVDRFSENIQKIGELSKVSSNSLEKGESLILDGIARLSKLSDRIQSLFADMEQFEARTQAVLEALRGIDEISKQTSMLAVNASIEAVKAGEFGKGFMVVSDEIRRLSQNTTDANKKTAVMISQFQEEFHRFHENLESVRNTMLEVMGNSENIRQTFVSLHGDVIRTGHSKTRMQENTDQQLQAIRDMDQLIRNISTETYRIVKNIQESVEAIQAVHDQVAALQQSTDVFIIDGQSRPEQPDESETPGQRDDGNGPV
ncbi:methyl-accepting chemotaxis protein [bacterium]|nr:methyl-accepting chemotaxis protein [bacterium]